MDAWATCLTDRYLVHWWLPDGYILSHWRHGVDLQLLRFWQSVTYLVIILANIGTGWVETTVNIQGSAYCDACSVDISCCDCAFWNVCGNVSRHKIPNCWLISVLFGFVNFSSVNMIAWASSIAVNRSGGCIETDAVSARNPQDIVLISPQGYIGWNEQVVHVSTVYTHIWVTKFTTKSCPKSFGATYLRVIK